jgi:2-polyprenyl-3-methyl-5-hydroxy-6-metoxy-1,4-benzoquinol methylase
MSQQANAFTDGEGYERLMGRWSQPTGLQFLDWLDLPKGLRWLDVGCGNGAFTEVLAARAAPSELIGIDPSEGQLTLRGSAGTR